MKILGETETAKMDRKLLKPQVERRRRERMNRSLENLKTLLLQGPEFNGLNQRRLEKAEILEYTVRFLQNSVAQAKKTNGVEEGEKRQFMDGFSSCLQKAARFLSDEGEAQGLEGSVTSSLCQRLAHPCVSTSVRLPVRIHGSWKTQPSKAQHRARHSPVCKQGLPATCKKTVPQPNKVALKSTDSNKVHTAARRSSHHHHHAPVSQTVWRPWP